jgi:hypothetical protein
MKKVLLILTFVLVTSLTIGEVTPPPAAPVMPTSLYRDFLEMDDLNQPPDETTPGLFALSWPAPPYIILSCLHEDSKEVLAILKIGARKIAYLLLDVDIFDLDNPCGALGAIAIDRGCTLHALAQAHNLIYIYFTLKVNDQL